MELSRIVCHPPPERPVTPSRVVSTCGRVAQVIQSTAHLQVKKAQRIGTYQVKRGGIVMRIALQRHLAEADPAETLAHKYPAWRS